jgi:hypothetical protein
MGFRVLPRCSQDLCLCLLHFTASKLDTVYTIIIGNADSAITVVFCSRIPWFESQFERRQHTFKILNISLGLPAKFRHSGYLTQSYAHFIVHSFQLIVQYQIVQRNIL